jgi:hypothetical protein
MYALATGCDRVVSLLVEGGADVNAADNVRM